MKDVDHGLLVEKLAQKLQGSLKAPVWASYVKTGHGKQRPPVRNDWWQIRGAAVLLSVEKLGPVGVSKLSIKYGNRKNMGYAPERHANASRNILRKILQQLESNGLVKLSEKDIHKGRIITPKGIKLINLSAKEAKLEVPKPTVKPLSEKNVTSVPVADSVEKKKSKKKE